MRIIYVAAAVGMATAVLLIGPAVLMGASAHADTYGYDRCVGNITEIPLWDTTPETCSLLESLSRISIRVSPLLPKLRR